MNSIEIRPIQKKDNPEVAKMIREVLIEQNAPQEGTAYADKSLDEMFETYDKNRSEYFVLLEKNQIKGSVGISPLEGGEDDVCELQKMYFQPEVRGRGLGAQMMQTCLNFAKENNFNSCYIETLPWMKAAQKLYQRSGFEYIDHRLGNTGHHACTVWMLKKI